MPESDPKFDAVAQRIADRAYNLLINSEKMVREAAKAIATDVVTHTPLWSGQARLNWTASVSTSKPPQRSVNVPRKNARIRRGKDGTKKFSGGRQGTFKDITVDPVVAASAREVSLSAIRQVIDTYQYPNRPVRSLTTVTAPSARTPKIYLSNSLNYISKLWSGSWPSNPRTLESELDVGQKVIRKWFVNILRKR